MERHLNGCLFFMERRSIMAQMRVSVKTPPLVKLEPFRGMNVSGSPTEISQNQSPDMLNMALDSTGALNKRTGYSRVFPTSLGTGKINGLYEFKKSDGSSIFLIAWGTNLYTQSGNAQPVSIYSGLANQKVNFFTTNGKCYIMDGTNYLVYDGTTVSQITPYVPTIQMSKPPAGGGTAYEDFNLLGNKFKDSFSGTGTDTVFQLSLTGLDATTVTAQVGTSTINEGSGLTVDRTNGKVTFTTAPASGTNNVIITAGKTVSGYAERIKNCTFSIGFGGSNDTRMFIAGNANMQEYVFRSGLLDPTYWPENGYYKFLDKVMGFSKQYDYLVIERISGKHQVRYSMAPDGTVTFPSKPINNETGCIASNSIQIIDNNPISLSKDGVYAITATNVIDERNVVHISKSIDKRLLLEAGLDAAVSIDFDRKYWLALNGNVYVLDYSQKTPSSPFGEWYLYDNIKASYFLEMGDYLYFGSSTDGIVYKFNKDANNANSFNDDGVAINAYWKSKALDFNSSEHLKTVEELYIGINPMSRTSVSLSYESDKMSATIGDNQPIKFSLFDFNYIDFNNFSFRSSQFPQEVRRKIKAKKITHFQLIITNSNLNEGLTVLSLGIKFNYGSFIK
jgi:hypothetical protein